MLYEHIRNSADCCGELHETLVWLLSYQGIAHFISINLVMPSSLNDDLDFKYTDSCAFSRVRIDTLIVCTQDMLIHLLLVGGKLVVIISG